MKPRRLAARRLAILGALAGAFASAYLVVDYVGGSTICLTGSGCDIVRSSPLAYPLGIPLPVAGLAFYLLAVIGLLATADRRIGSVEVLSVLVAWTWLGVAVMGALTLVEVLVIRALCGWCLVAALASVMLATGATWWARSSGAAGATGPPGGSSRGARRVEAQRLAEERGVRRFTAVAGTLLVVLLVGLVLLPGMAIGQPPPSGAPADTSGRPRLGDGPVGVVVFSDFECPACAQVAPWLEQLAADGTVMLVYRYFPLASVHPNAVAAARAAEAAHRQGAFWAFHDELFATQAAWATLPNEQAAAAFESAAARLGLDMTRWRSDLAGAASPVSADVAEAERLGLRGTPSIFIDGDYYEGRLTFEDLAAAVAAAR